MLDIKSIRENLEAVKARLDRRGPDTSKGLDELLAKELAQDPYRETVADQAADRRTS